MTKYLEFRSYGGWGDVFHSLTMAMAYAEKYGRTLIVNWTYFTYLPDDMQGKRNAFDLYFDGLDLAVPVISGDDLNDRDYRDTRFIDRWDRVRGFVKKYRQDEEDYPEQRVVYEYWCSISEDFVLADPQLARRYYGKLVPKRDVVEAVERFARAHFEGYTIIGVHSRTGNGEQVRKSLIPADEDQFFEYFCHKIDEFSEAAGPTKVFVCGDTPRILSRFQRHYQNAVTTERFRPPDGAGAHCEKNGYQDDGGVGVFRRAKVPALNYELSQQYGEIKIAKEALVDMFLLAKCDYLLHNGSEFVLLPIAVGDRMKTHLNGMRRKRARLGPLRRELRYRMHMARRLLGFKRNVAGRLVSGK